MVSQSGMDRGGKRSATPLSDTRCPGAQSEQTGDAPRAVPRQPKAVSSLRFASAVHITPAMMCASVRDRFPSLIVGYQRLTCQKERCQSTMLSATALQSSFCKRSVQKKSTLYICKLLAIRMLCKKVVFFILRCKVFPHNLGKRLKKIQNDPLPNFIGARGKNRYLAD